MSSTKISELALQAHTDREQRRATAAAEKAAAQRALQDRLLALLGPTLNSEAAIVLFGSNTDPRTKDLEWHALDSENADWELFTAGAGIHARETTNRKTSRGYHFGADIGNEALLVVRLTTPELQHRGDFHVQVSGGPILPAKDLASVGEAIRAAQS